jgi:hypothetical protein
MVGGKHLYRCFEGFGRNFSYQEGCNGICQLGAVKQLHTSSTRVRKTKQFYSYGNIRRNMDLKREDRKLAKQCKNTDGFELRRKSSKIADVGRLERSLSIAASFHGRRSPAGCSLARVLRGRAGLVRRPCKLHLRQTIM